MLDIRIDKIILDSYRDYKIDLLEGKVQESIMFKVIEHIISSGLRSLLDLYSELDDYPYIKVCAITGEIIDRELEWKTCTLIHRKYG